MPTCINVHYEVTICNTCIDTGAGNIESDKEGAEEEEQSRREEEREVQEEGRPKRKILKPKYLKDYV